MGNVIHMLKNLYCIIGQSGSGKDTLANNLQEKCGYKKVLSYTTRPARENDKTDEFSHVFTTIAQYQKDVSDNEIIAETYFDGKYYWVTKKMVDDADIYIVDPKGLKDLRKQYTSRPIVAIYLWTRPETRMKRMRKRGDSSEQISQRLQNDRIMFSETARESSSYDYSIVADGSEPDVVLQMCKIINECEGR